MFFTQVAEKQHGHENTYVIIAGASGTIISTSVVIFILLYLRKILRRWVKDTLHSNVFILTFTINFTSG